MAATRDPDESELGNVASKKQPTFPQLKKPVVSGVCALWSIFAEDEGQSSGAVSFLLRNVKLETRFLVRTCLHRHFLTFTDSIIHTACRDTQQK
jgi:hypothetical protein